jgi:integrase
LKGFGLIVRGKNRRSWIIQYRIGKQQRKYKFADASKFTAVQAREMAKDLFADITKGRDPQGERKAAKQAERSVAATLTLRQALEKYIEMKEQEVREGTYRDNSLKITKLYLLGARYFGPLHSVDVNAITRQAVAARLHEIRKAGSDTTAGRARAQLSAAFTRLLQEGLVEFEVNPCRDTKGQAARPQRDRVLNDDELRSIWNCCDMNTDFGRIVRLLVLSGCRREEIGGLRWSEIDFDKGQINLPGERTKNGLPHSFTLPDTAMQIIRSVEQMHDREYLFGVRSVGFRSWQQAMARFKPVGVVDEWKLHDIRRSVATGMADHDIAEPHIIEATLNHVSGHKGGIAGVYNKAKYTKQMAIALAKWADHVQRYWMIHDRRFFPRTISPKPFNVSSQYRPGSDSLATV